MSTQIRALSEYNIQRRFEQELDRQLPDIFDRYLLYTIWGKVEAPLFHSSTAVTRHIRESVERKLER